jgi:hypothetical protein
MWLWMTFLSLFCLLSLPIFIVAVLVDYGMNQEPWRKFHAGDFAGAARHKWSVRNCPRSQTAVEFLPGVGIRVRGPRTHAVIRPRTVADLDEFRLFAIYVNQR